MELAKRADKKSREYTTEDFRKAQMLWSFMVAIATVTAALYHLATPTSSLITQESRSYVQADGSVIRGPDRLPASDSERSVSALSK